MTEADWLRCTDLVPMLDFLRGRAAERELRLFCLACCRRIWDVMPPEGRRAVEVAARHLDGRATDEELDTANIVVGELCERGELPAGPGSAANAAFHASWGRCEVEEAEDCGRNAESAGLSWAAVAELLREAVGNPFRGAGPNQTLQQTGHATNGLPDSPPTPA